MNDQPKSLTYDFRNPFRLALAVLILSLITMIGGILLGKTGALSLNELFPWLSSAAYILLFAIFNSVISIASSDLEKYMKHSLFSFAIVLFISAGMAYVFSGISISDAGSYKWIYSVLFIAYIALLSIGGLIKRIALALAKEEEMWKNNQ